jgi:ABC-type dipeptide/oligopeptide/nickel transport system permease subunit
MRAPPVVRDNPLTRSVPGLVGIVFLGLMLLACVATLPYTLGSAGGGVDAVGAPRYNAGDASAGRLAPFWWPADAEQSARVDAAEAQAGERARYLLGTDVLGRSLLVRSLAGGGISLGIGISAAFVSVLIGTLYGAVSGYLGGKADAMLMRVVDVLYGLPYILLVVLLAVASEAVIERQVTRAGARERWAAGVLRDVGAPDGVDRGTWLDAPAEASSSLVRGLRERLAKDAPDPEAAGGRISALMAAGETNGAVLQGAALAARPPRELRDSTRLLLDVGTLLLAIGGVSWLTMARVIRGQVLSLKHQQFVEAARATGASASRIFLRHLLPNLVGPIIVYATLTVPQAILQESFLSFLGIGVKPPLPSWGNLAAEGLGELNGYRSNWWLLLFPCVLLGVTLLALNFVGEGLREAFDPKRSRR